MTNEPLVAPLNPGEVIAQVAGALPEQARSHVINSARFWAVQMCVRRSAAACRPARPAFALQRSDGCHPPSASPVHGAQQQRHQRQASQVSSTAATRSCCASTLPRKAPKSGWAAGSGTRRATGRPRLVMVKGSRVAATASIS